MFLTSKYWFILVSAIVLAVIYIPSSAYSEEVRCERWQGKWWQKFNAVRCVKSDGAGPNNIVVSHKMPCRDAAAPCLLKYTVGMWTGPCGEVEGQNRLYTNQYLRKRGSMTYVFDGAPRGACKEFYVFECTRDGRPYDCHYAVRLMIAPPSPPV